MIRLLPTVLAPGPLQMALDEALLETATTTTLRLYGWAPPAISLGYFQDFATVAPYLPSGMAVVRRITGGGAIWHEHEVTYSLIGSLGSAGLPPRTRDLYPLLHMAIQTELAHRGAPLVRQFESVGDRRYAEEPRCFASPAADDLVHADGGKALGSAARARGVRVLVHGSLKLATNPWDGPAVAPCGLSSVAASEALIAGISTALGLPISPGSLTTTEEKCRDRIFSERYGDSGWVVERRGPRA